jgi:hypothetical protein
MPSAKLPHWFRERLQRNSSNSSIDEREQSAHSVPLLYRNGNFQASMQRTFVISGRRLARWHKTLGDIDTLRTAMEIPWERQEDRRENSREMKRIIYRMMVDMEERVEEGR